MAAGVVPAWGIVGGREVDEKTHADVFASLVSVNTGTGDCGGVYLGERRVLTAAHCVVTGSSVKPLPGMAVWAGSLQKNAGERAAVVDARVHPDYRAGDWDTHLSWQNDVAVLQLASDLRVPAATLSRTSPAPGTPVVTAGWGRTEDDKPSDVLRSVELATVTGGDCAKGSAPFQVTAAMVCATGPDPSKVQGIGAGDSGGPLLAHTADGSKVVGVASWARRGEGTGYVAAGAPSVFASTEALGDWIRSVSFGVKIKVGSFPKGIAADGRSVYVTNIDSDTVTVIDAETNHVVGDPIPVGKYPNAIAVSDHRAYIANGTSATVTVVD
ncbi:trypsin-like serine protease, partial [Streptomyces sp. 900105245]